jgi:hypothetical protein
MSNLTDQERREIVHDLALDLVEHMGATEPPIWVENLLKDPPSLIAEELNLVEALAWVLEELYNPTGADLLAPKDLPLPERRFTLALELFEALTRQLLHRLHGLTRLLIPDIQPYGDYFARVLLAPDPMVERYRQRGGPFERFAETFLIPKRVASVRWREPLLPRGRHGLDFSLS